MARVTLQFAGVDTRLSDDAVARACESFGPVGRVVSVYDAGDPPMRSVYVDMTDPASAARCARVLADLGVAGRPVAITMSVAQPKRDNSNGEGEVVFRWDLLEDEPTPAIAG